MLFRSVYWRDKVICKNAKGPAGEECVAIYSKKYPDIEIADVYISNKTIVQNSKALNGTCKLVELNDNKTACFKVNNFMWMLTYYNYLDNSFSVAQKTIYKNPYTKDEWEELIELQTLGCRTTSSCQNLPISFEGNYIRPSISY